MIFLDASRTHKSAEENYYEIADYLNVLRYSTYNYFLFACLSDFIKVSDNQLKKRSLPGAPVSWKVLRN